MSRRSLSSPATSGPRGRRARKGSAGIDTPQFADPFSGIGEDNLGYAGYPQIVQLRRPAIPLLPHAAFERFLAHRDEQRHLAEKSVSDYAGVLRRFLRYLDARSITDIWDVTSAVVQNYLLSVREGQDERTGKPHSIHTVINYGTHLLACIRWLEEEHLLPPGVADRVTLPAVQVSEQKRPVTFTDDEVAQLFAACLVEGQENAISERTALGLRNQALLAVLIDSGVRRSEVCSMRVEEVDWQRGTLRVRESKTRLRTVAIGRTFAHSYLHRYVNSERGRTWLVESDDGGARWDDLPDLTARSGPLWVNRDGRPLTDEGVKSLFQRLAKRTSIEKQCSAHVCRRYAITNALRGGMSIIDASIYFAVSPEVIRKHYYAAEEEAIMAEAQAASPLDRLAEAQRTARQKKGGRQGREYGKEIL